jgi:hypothetical protein
MHSFFLSIYTFKTWNVRSMYRAGSLRTVAEVQVKKDEMGRACSTNGEKRNAYRVLVGKPEGKRPLGGPRRRWVNNIKIDLREIGCPPYHNARSLTYFNF